MNKTSLYQGVNLGGWLSQYEVYSLEHFRQFITESDIEQIASWGMDHIRLPFDYPLLEDDDQPGVYKESGFDFVEACVAWCQRSGLRVVLDMHKAPGFSFDEVSGSSLFGSTIMQERYLALWDELARRFRGRYTDTLAFELLNEVALPSSGPWNELATQAIVRIRAYDPSRLIVVGGNHHNSLEQLPELALPADEHLLYTFHFYRPFAVTHQRAHWLPLLLHYGKSVDYPGAASGLEQALQNSPEDEPMIRAALGTEVGKPLDKTFVRTALLPAFDFMTETGQPLYCGEFGVISAASPGTQVNWTRDVVEVLEEYGIGRAYWSYNELDFSLVDEKRRVRSRDLVTVLSRR